MSADPQFFAILHTHWDREWYRSLGTFLPRWARVMDSIVRLLESDDRVTAFHLDGQTILVEDYLSLRPGTRDRVRALVQSGRLPLGPWYVLADEVLSSGEALVRNLAIGLADAREFGDPLALGYSPDAFGHPQILPSVLRGFGLDTAVVWRGVPSGTDDRFRWEGPDGSTVFVWRLPPNGYESGTSTGELVARARGPVVPVFVGLDHAAPDPEIADHLGELQVDRLDRIVGRMSTGDAQVISGELRQVGDQWLLGDTLSARIPLKLAIWNAGRRLERAADPLVALAGDQLERETLAATWRGHLESHFHDTICGTVSDEVAADALARVRRVSATCDDLATRAWDRIIGHDPVEARRARRPVWRPALTFWNPAARPRGGVVVVDIPMFVRDVRVGPRASLSEGLDPDTKSLVVVDGQGRRLASQRLSVRRGLEWLESPQDYPDQDEVEVVRTAVLVRDTPGLGAAVCRVTDGEPEVPAETVRVNGPRLENDLIRAEIGPHGLATITDLVTGEVFSSIGELEVAPDEGDLYTSAAGDSVPVDEVMTVEATQLGPLVGEIVAAGAAHSVTWTLHAGSRILRLTVRYENGEPDRRVRLSVPTGVTESPLWTGGAFGPVSRSVPERTVSARTGESSPMGFPCQRALSIANGTRGMTVLVGGLTECAFNRKGTVVVTLLRGCGELSRPDLEARPGHAAWTVATPGAQCLGVHEWMVGFMPHDQTMLESYAEIMEAADDFDTPIMTRSIRNALDFVEPGSGVELEGAGLAFSSCRPATQGEGAIVLRCYNVTPKETTGAWRLRQPASRAMRVRLDETEEHSLELRDAGRTVLFAAGPRAIVSVRVEFLA